MRSLADLSSSKHISDRDTEQLNIKKSKALAGSFASALLLFILL